MDSKGVEDIMALTPMQEGMLFHYLKDPGSDYYFEQLCLSISGEIDLDCFKGAWDVVVETNEMLRTRFSWEKLNEPVQVVLKKHSPRFIFYDFSGDGDKRRLLEKVKSSDRKKTFDLNDVPSRITLCKTGTGKYEMIISNHHILYDGWSNGIILKELFSSYHDLLRQKKPAKPQKHKYKEYIKWMQTREKEKQEKYWRSYLEGFEAGLEFSIKKKKGGNKRTGNDHYKVNILKAERAKLDTFIKTRKITLACLFYSAWGIVLQKYNNSEDVIFGTVISGRPAGVKGIEDIVGLFINTVPLRVKIKNNGCEKTADLLQRINKELQEREEYEAASLVEIREYSRLGVQGELFDNIVVIENYPLENVLSEGEGGGLCMDSYWMFEKTHYDLTLGITLFDEIEVDFHFERDLFDVSGINRLARHFMNTVWEIINNPGRAVRELDILTEEEKNKILYGFNKTKAKYPHDKTIHGIFAEQAEKKPFHTAVIFIDEQLTYRELNKRSDATAHELKSRGVGPGSIAGIMAGRSLEMLIGIMGILKVGGAYLPLDPDYPPGRIDYMLKDSNAAVLLNGRELSDPCRGTACCAHQDSPPASLAYIIYTSGTTGKPKGVMVEHSAVLNRLYWVKERYRLNEKDVILQATSFIFDVSVCEMFRWIPAGGKLCFLSPGGEKDPGQIVETIARYGVTTADFVPSVLSLILDHVDRQKIVGELSGLRWVFTGVEVVDLNLVKRFNETLNKVNRTTLINAYGPTESTVDVTYFDCSNIRGDNNDVVPIGKPMANVQVYILDGHGGIQPIGVYGELCIAGKGLARGYLNHPELTAEKFVSVYYRSYRTNRTYISSKKIYKTGDLARWLEDGNIEFLGRMDHQVKIRGFRVELGEVESHLLRHEKIKAAVVTAVDRDDGEKYLCAYIVSGEKIEVSELKNKLAVELPGYMIPAYIVQLDKIPLTAGGNVDRRALPEPGSGIMGDEYTAPVNLLEEELVSIWSEVLNLEKEAIGTSHNFFQLGGHSLKATTLISRIHKKLDIKVPLQEIFDFPTIKGLSGYIGTAAGDKYVSIESLETREYYPLSSAQKRMYILQQMEKKNTVYNMSDAVVLEGPLDIDRFEETFRQLIRRHESLRTSFFIIGDEPVQRIHEEVEFEIEHYNLAAKNAKDREEKKNPATISHFVRPFDLSRPPFLRAGLIKTNEKESLLMLDMHHIIADGTSIGIFIKDFMALYRGEDLAPLRVQYKDFAQWQNSLKKSESLARQEPYWLGEFADEPPKLNMPLDYKRPSRQNFDGSSVTFEVDAETFASLRALADAEGATLFMVLLSLVSVLLWKLSGSECVAVGTPIAGRRHGELERIMGVFVNTLVLKSAPKGEKTFKGFLDEMKQKTLAAYENQDYQFEDLVEKVVDRRDPARHPIFDVMFALQNMDISEVSIPGLKVRPCDYAPDTALFDLYLTAEERENRLVFRMGYCTRLFKKETVKSFIQYFREIIAGVIKDKEIRLEALEISQQLLEPEMEMIEDAQGDFGF